MKKLRLIILVAIGFFSFLCLFSYLSGMEEGEIENWLVIAGLGSGILCWALGRKWGRNGKLPESVTEKENDRA